jgi:tetratricopeptide (TPR) repeat protein
MSRFGKTINIRWTNQSPTRKFIFRVTTGLLLACIPAIFAGTTIPAESFTDGNPVPVLATNASNPLLPLITRISTDSIPAQIVLATTNGSASTQTNLQPPMDPLVQKLETARYLRKMRQTKDVELLLVSLLGNDVPEDIQKSALLELAALAQDQDDLPRAQQICAQFMNRWPDDIRIPEVLLRQGRIFRQLGLHNLALTKFYAVMTAALTLKNDRLDYYEQLVMQAQTEIADTHFNLGKYADAAEYYSRLLKQDNPDIDRPQIQYKLVRCYSSTTNYDEAIAAAQDYLAHHAGSLEEPEVRFDLATALKCLGRDNESLQQVLTLLQQQNSRAAAHPEDWAYWRQRAGNLVANQFYREGNYTRALDIYSSLAQLDTSPQWQLPVWYQIGMSYEHLWQPQKAVEIYNQIISRQTELGTNAPPSLVSITDMARWRISFIQWQNSAETTNQRLADTNSIVTTNTIVTANVARLEPSHE